MNDVRRPRPSEIYDEYLGTLPYLQGVAEAPPLSVIVQGENAYDAWVIERWKREYATAAKPNYRQEEQDRDR